MLAVSSLDDDRSVLQDRVAARLADPDYKAFPERAFLIHLTAWDVNCPQHITPRFTPEELKPQLQQLIDRITELETELSRLRADSANQMNPVGEELR